MAALVTNQDFDLIAFRKYLAERLPEYARPLFLRIRCEIETTATFKPKKQDLSREGYDPHVSDDAIYFDDQVRQAFVKLDAALYERILTADVRL
jgi:fatty-acyl-CoA synthase